MALPHGIPQADTYRRVFERIAPSALEQCFQKWVEQIVSTAGAQVRPIDGKTVKGSYDRNKRQSSLHLVSAWASEHRILLGQVKVERKTNEIKAIPARLHLLDISGCVITIDAMDQRGHLARKLRFRLKLFYMALKC